MLSQLKRLIRPMYSSPPIHGALIVSEVLGDEALSAQYYQAGQAGGHGPSTLSEDSAPSAGPPAASMGSGPLPRPPARRVSMGSGPLPRPPARRVSRSGARLPRRAAPQP